MAEELELSRGCCCGSLLGAEGSELGEAVERLDQRVTGVGAGCYEPPGGLARLVTGQAREDAAGEDEPGHRDDRQCDRQGCEHRGRSDQRCDRREDRERGSQQEVLDRVAIDRDPAQQLTGTQLGDAIAREAQRSGEETGAQRPDTVERNTINDNAASSSDPHGEASSIDAGMIVGASPLIMRDSQVDRNLTATTSITVGDVGPVGSALEVDGSGTIVDTSIDGNVAATVSPGGAASTAGGLFVLDTDLLTVKNSTISKNLTMARSDTGSATVLGGGVFNNTQLRMDHVMVSHNTARAEGPTGVAQGGGTWNGVAIAGPPVELTLTKSRVTHNILHASSGITPQGGGIYTTLPVTLNHTVIAHNEPDQCAGCASGPTAATVASSHRRRAHRRRALRRPLPEPLRHAVGRS